MFQDKNHNITRLEATNDQGNRISEILLKLEKAVASSNDSLVIRYLNKYQEAAGRTPRKAVI